MELFKRENLIYTFVGISSCITYLFGQHAYLSQMMKIILGFSNFLAVCLLLRRNAGEYDGQPVLIHKICIFLIIYAGIDLFFHYWMRLADFRLFCLVRFI